VLCRNRWRPRSKIRKHYSFVGQTIATLAPRASAGVRPCTGVTCSAPTYFLTDHLGSIVALTDANGTLITQQRYLPFGGQRTLSDYQTTGLTDYGYTGQRLLDEDMGDIMDYKARFYSPTLGRFLQPDKITPGGPQGLNRYAYVLNNPINANDPSGHKCVGEPGECLQKDGKTSINTVNRKLVPHKPVFGRTQKSSGGDVSGSQILRYYFPGAGSLSWEDTADSAVPTSPEYRHPNQFNQMSSSEKGVYAINAVIVIEEYLKSLGPQNPGPDNVFVSVNWEASASRGVRSVTSIDLINASTVGAKIIDVRTYGDTAGSYGSSDWVGTNGRSPGVLHFDLNPPKTVNSSQSIFVRVYVKAFGEPIENKLATITGSNDPGPWLIPSQ
jgi:RHS repeat-associated protein